LIVGVLTYLYNVLGLWCVNELRELNKFTFCCPVYWVFTNRWQHSDRWN